MAAESRNRQQEAQATRWPDVRNQLTALEILAADNPDILTATKHALDRGKSSLTTAQLISSKFQVSVSKSTMEKYRQKRWARQRAQLAQQKADFQAAAALVGESTLDKAASALLFEAIRTLTPQTLLGIKRLKLQHDKLKLERRAARQGKAEATSSKAKQEAWEAKTQEDRDAIGANAANAMRRMFGMGTVQEEAEKKALIDASNAQYFKAKATP